MSSFSQDAVPRLGVAGLACSDKRPQRLKKSVAKQAWAWEVILRMQVEISLAVLAPEPWAERRDPFQGQMHDACAGM
jgi:hypothetical protein